MPSLRKLDGRGAAASVTRDGEDAEAQAAEAPKKGKKRKLPKKDNSHKPQSRKRGGDGGGSKQATSEAAAARRDGEDANAQTEAKAKKGKNRNLESPLELPFTGICQQGKLVCNIGDNGAGVHRITGLWAMEGLSMILEAPDECGKFEYEHMCSGDSTAFELPGRYTGGFFNWAVKIVERDVTLRFQQNNAGYHNVYGEGSNVFGKYNIVGTLAKNGTITLSRHYPVVGRPAARAAMARSLEEVFPRVLQPSDRQQVLRHQQQRLLLLRHAAKCPHQDNQCPVTPHCAGTKRLWKHIAECKDQKCLVPHCVSSRYVLSHSHRCKGVRCPVCGPVREAIYRTHIKSLDQGMVIPVAKLKTKFGELLKGLQNHTHGWVFNTPVDPVELGLPDYFEVIEKPMDLGTVKKQLENNLYKSLKEVERDVNLTFDNAMLYNPDGSVVWNMAKELKDKLAKDLEGLVKQQQQEEREPGGSKSNEHEATRKKRKVLRMKKRKWKKKMQQEKMQQERQEKEALRRQLEEANAKLALAKFPEMVDLTEDGPESTTDATGGCPNQNGVSNSPEQPKSLFACMQIKQEAVLAKEVAEGRASQAEERMVAAEKEAEATRIMLAEALGKVDRHGQKESLLSNLGSHNAELRPSPIHGIGVFALAPISEGTKLFQFNGEPSSRTCGLSAEEIDGLPNHVQHILRKFILPDKEGLYHVPGHGLSCALGVSFYLNSAENTNHKPNVDFGSEFDSSGLAAIVATRDIAKGEELLLLYKVK